MSDPQVRIIRRRLRPWVEHAIGVMTRLYRRRVVGLTITATFEDGTMARLQYEWVSPDEVAALERGRRERPR